jgi:chromosome segregation ATPase
MAERRYSKLLNGLQVPSILQQTNATPSVTGRAPRAQGMQAQQLQSLRTAVSDAIAEKEETFEALGQARERGGELQAALTEANAQIRLLTSELSALHSELHAGLGENDVAVKAGAQAGSGSCESGQGGGAGAGRVARAVALVDTPTDVASVGSNGGGGEDRKDPQALEAELEVVRKELSDAKAALAAALDAGADAKVVALQAELDEVKGQLAEAHKALAAAQAAAEASATRPASAASAEAASAAAALLDALAAVRAELDAVKAAAQEQAAVAQAELLAAHNAFEQAQRSMSAREQALRSGLDAAQASLAALSSEKSGFEAREAELVAQVRALDEGSAGAEASAETIADIDGEQDTFAEVAKLQGELAQLRAAEAQTTDELSRCGLARLRCSEHGGIMHPVLQCRHQRPLQASAAALMHAPLWPDRKSFCLTYHLPHICVCLNSRTSATSRRIDELAAEKQKAVSLRHDLVEARAELKQQEAHLRGEAEVLRSQLLLGAADDELRGHLEEFVRAREALAEGLEAQEAELEALRTLVRFLGPSCCSETCVCM